jgi:high affinity sulfate transporter 1
MDEPRTSSSMPKLARIAPGLPSLLRYERANFRHDLLAGLSVAAVAVPVGVAYAQLAGFNPAVGLYASVLPLVAYALFGTSRQLIVGPDAATCALVAAAVAPLAGGNADLYLSLSVTVTFLAGLLCIGGSFLKLGALADFLSRPILVGFMNGVALSIALGQLGKLFGLPIESGGMLSRLLEFASKLPLTHWPTLCVGLATFMVLAVSSRLIPRLPPALVALVAAALSVVFFHLEASGVKTVGPVPAGLPPLRLPTFPLDLLPQLATEAAGIALIAFTSMVLASRSFAAKRGYDVDPDREFAALGAANIASALSQGFAVSGADSRTAMADASGGRTQMTGLVAAAAVAAVLLFFAGSLQYVPIAALGAVLVMAAVSLMDLESLRRIYRLDWHAFALSIIATLAVVSVGAINGILFAVVLSLLRFVQLVSRPPTEVLGEVQGLPGFHGIELHAEATKTPGLVLFRFNGPIVFFNAAHFKRQALAAAQAEGSDLRWFVLDMLPVTMIDATGILTLSELEETLRARGATVVLAGRVTQWANWARRHGVEPEKSRFVVFPTLRQAVKAYRAQAGIAHPDLNSSRPEQVE